VNVKLFLCKLGTHKGEGGSGVIAPSFLTSALNGSEWSPSNLDLFTPAKAPPVPTKQKAGRAPEPVWTFGTTKKIKLLPLPGIEKIFLSFSTRRLYTKPAEVPHLLFSCGAATQRGPWPPHSWGFQITHNDASQSVGLLLSSDQLVAEPLPDNIQHSQQIIIHSPVGFEPTISAGERPQTYASDRAATGTGITAPTALKRKKKKKRLNNIFLYVWT